MAGVAPADGEAASTAEKPSTAQRSRWKQRGRGNGERSRPQAHARQSAHMAMPPQPLPQQPQAATCVDRNGYLDAARAPSHEPWTLSRAPAREPRPPRRLALGSWAHGDAVCRARMAHMQWHEEEEEYYRGLVHCLPSSLCLEGAAAHRATCHRTCPSPPAQTRASCRPARHAPHRAACTQRCSRADTPSGRARADSPSHAPDSASCNAATVGSSCRRSEDGREARTAH